jgi:hypothetical protein
MKKYQNILLTEILILFIILIFLNISILIDTYFFKLFLISSIITLICIQILIFNKKLFYRNTKDDEN